MLYSDPAPTVSVLAMPNVAPTLFCMPRSATAAGSIEHFRATQTPGTSVLQQYLAWSTCQAFVSSSIGVEIEARRNPSQAVYGGGDFDGFLAALSSDGAKLCYGSYFGGNGHDTLEGLAVGGARIYASGITSSTDLQQKRSQIQRGYGGGPYDAIIVGLDAPVDRSCR